MLRYVWFPFVFIVALGSCNIENGRCEEICLTSTLAKRDDELESIFCVCPQNETIAKNGRECLCKSYWF